MKIENATIKTKLRHKCERMNICQDYNNIFQSKLVYAMYRMGYLIVYQILLILFNFKMCFTIFMLAASVSNEIEKFTFSWMTLKNKMNYTQGKRRETNLPTTDRHVFLNNNGLANFFMTTKIERIIYCSSNDFHIWQNLWNLSWFKFDSFRS